MLKFDQDQFQSIGAQAQASFEDRMVVHLRRFFPEHSAALDDEQMRALIRHGIERGARFGLVTERNVCKYIDVMFAMGAQFDDDPTRAWAVAILRDTSARPLPSDRINALYDAVLERLRAAADRGAMIGGTVPT